MRSGPTRLIADAELLLELGDPHLKRPRLPTLKRIDAGLKLEILFDEVLVFGFERRGRAPLERLLKTSSGHLRKALVVRVSRR
jgi:hypothetical protein